MGGPIMHASDFSSASRPAFRQAVALAKAMKRPLLIVHVMSPATLLTGDMAVAPHVWPRLEDTIARVARRGVDRLVGRARAAGVKASALLLRGVPYEEIVRAARRRGAASIVMGTHGRTGVAGLLLGSVAARVVAHARCPVMTVRGA